MKNNGVDTRIAMLRFLMIFGVIIVHTPPTWKVYEVDGTMWAYIISFLQNGVFRAGVPVLTLISGYLLFKANADLRYLALLQKKARSLLVPFMVFNIGHILLQIGLRFATGRWLGDDLFNQSLTGWMSSLFGIWRPPENEPLHFLRELIVLILLSPAIGWLIRKAPALGLLTVGLIFLPNFDGYLINRSDMPVEFYVGGLAAVYKWNLTALDRFRYASLVTFVLLCVFVVVFEVTDVTWLRLAAPVLVWSAAAYLDGTRLEQWLASLSIYSFFLYLTHAPLMRIIWIFFQKLAPNIPVPMFTATAPFFVAILCISLYKMLVVLIPRQLDWVIGGRTGKSSSTRNVLRKSEIMQETHIAAKVECVAQSGNKFS